VGKSLFRIGLDGDRAVLRFLLQERFDTGYMKERGELGDPIIHVAIFIAEDMHKFLLEWDACGVEPPYPWI
jgi:hypothetical protein